MTYNLQENQSELYKYLQHTSKGLPYKCNKQSTKEASMSYYAQSYEKTGPIFLRYFYRAYVLKT
jgi:hypothetical protein